MLLQGATLGSCVQRVWSQSDAMTGEGWGARLKARQNWDVDAGKRVGENGSTSALMRAGGMSVFPVGTESRTMRILEKCLNGTTLTFEGWLLTTLNHQ